MQHLLKTTEPEIRFVQNADWLLEIGKRVANKKYKIIIINRMKENLIHS